MHKGTIEYWLEDENILTTPITIKPVVGEVISINTESDKDWYDRKFSSDKLYQKGMKGEFEVISIKRYITCHDVVTRDELDGKIYEFPGQKVFEVFEVFVKKIN